MENDKIQVLIETVDFPFDDDNIQELTHFDIGEEEDPEEVPARDAGVYREDVLPLSRQGRKRKFKKPGRKTKGQVIKIPKRQPPRAARVKSYQQYDTFDEVVQDIDDSDPEPVDDDGEPSSSKTWRVFVRKDGSGMHFDWPIFQDSSISIKDVVNIISSDASEISKESICTSIPQEFTNTGTFIVHLEEGLLKEEICNDGLGSWNTAQMFVRKYVRAHGNRLPLMTKKNDHNLKVVCEQFLHPGTDNRGDFIRRIYTGFDKDEHMIPLVVISYEWMGQPHPLTVYEDDTDKQTFENMTWKKCANPDEQVPILCRQGCDFDNAIGILLSSEKFNSYGKSVPQYVQESISFVVDVEACGGDRALFSDGNEWQRPSGSHRFFRIEYSGEDDVEQQGPEGGGGGDYEQVQRNHETSSWSIRRAAEPQYNASNSDIQVICRRYNGQKFSCSSGFIRKIYLVKILANCPPEVAHQIPNHNLAVISYSYRNSTNPTFIEQPERTLPGGEMIGEEVQIVHGDVVFDEDLSPEMREMVETVERKKKTNTQRLMELIQRIHRIDQISKKEGWSESSPEIRQIMQIGEMLENTCQ